MTLFLLKVALLAVIVFDIFNGGDSQLPEYVVFENNNTFKTHLKTAKIPIATI